mmetsp:Transcript_36768/g.82851  ORF Transcript_36768/g.82851 Transcript_36768/m.82851 type:complete len:202 (-) Transcript_36768:99-704(-)
MEGFKPSVLLLVLLEIHFVHFSLRRRIRAAGALPRVSCGCRRAGSRPLSPTELLILSPLPAHVHGRTLGIEVSHIIAISLLVGEVVRILIQHCLLVPTSSKQRSCYPLDPRLLLLHPLSRWARLEFPRSCLPCGRADVHDIHLGRLVQHDRQASQIILLTQVVKELLNLALAVCSALLQLNAKSPKNRLYDVLLEPDLARP